MTINDQPVSVEPEMVNQHGYKRDRGPEDLVFQASISSTSKAAKNFNNGGHHTANALNRTLQNIEAMLNFTGPANIVVVVTAASRVEAA